MKTNQRNKDFRTKILNLYTHDSKNWNQTSSSILQKSSVISNSVSTDEHIGSK